MSSETQLIEKTVPCLNQLERVITYSNRNDNPYKYIRVGDGQTGKRIGALYPEPGRYPSLTFNYQAFNKLPLESQKQLTDLIEKFDNFKRLLENKNAA